MTAIKTFFNFFSRVCIFCFYFYFCYKFNNPERTAMEFKFNLIDTLNSIGIPTLENKAKNYLKDPFIPFTFFLSVISFTVLNSLLGIKFFYFIAIICNTLVSLIYFKPFENFKRINIRSLNDLPNENFICLTIISIGLLAMLFKNDNEEDDENINDDDYDNDNLRNKPIQKPKSKVPKNKKHKE